MAVSNTSREVNSFSNPYGHTGVIGTVKGVALSLMSKM